ncbi:hypothetical protein [Blastococcus deserti]|uniref:Lipoprotein n=1 Tax=Blastococcus deserti TaxID=2259033 RepID=A0ABW4X9J3_9ACTN
MSTARSGSGTAVPRGRAVVALFCLLLPGCASAQRTGAAHTPAGAAADWLNRTYVVTCDGIVPDGFPATVVDGSARVPADGSRPPHYEHYDVRVTARASGDVDGDGAPDAVVLLDCSPQPSNGIVQEVQVFSSTGRLLGTLPSPRTLRENVLLPPVYDPAGLSVQDGEIVADMQAYGPDDFHASGPSVPLTVRWRFDGQRFVRASP